VTTPSPAQPASTGPAAADGQESARGRVLPEQSREDTDVGWGEYPVAGDERLYQDRPPHWDDF
jgi:hypothetical protein